MRWRNETPDPVRFELARRPYDVPSGGECEIPDRLSYAVERRKLPLTLVPGSGRREARSLAHAFLAALHGEILEPPHGTSDEDRAAIRKAAAFGERSREHHAELTELEATRTQTATVETKLAEAEGARAHAPRRVENAPEVRTEAPRATVAEKPVSADAPKATRK